MNSEAQITLIQPLSPAEVEQLEIFSAVVFFITYATLMALVAYSAYLMLRSSLPGRFLVFVGALGLVTFFLFRYYMGGDLELTLGPEGVLIEVASVSVAALLFAAGHLRMLFHFKKLSNGS